MTSITITLPAFADFSFTNGYPANYVAPEEISTRIDYTVTDPSDTQVAVGTIPEAGNEVVDLGASPAGGTYTVTFVATHFDEAGDGLPSNPVSVTVDVDANPSVLTNLAVTLETGPLTVRTSVNAEDPDGIEKVQFHARVLPDGLFELRGDQPNPNGANSTEYLLIGYETALRYNRQYEWKAKAVDNLGNTKELDPKDANAQVTTGLIPPPTGLASSVPVTVT
mmetsp:Transcript_36537/g.86787  ORF Transcript_36537/g.86787 Transcript_36537/m.86787 type:complete len:223 (-) Transcript_36537:2248-2916(-)